MKVFLRFFSIFLILAALLLAFVGSLHSGPYARLSAPDWLPEAQVAQVEPLAEAMRSICYGDDSFFYQRGDACKFSKQGLFVFTQGGIGVAILGFLLFCLSFVRFKKRVAKPKKAPASLQAPPSASAESAAKPAEASASVASVAPAAAAAPAAPASDSPSEKHAVIDDSELDALEKQLGGGQQEEEEDDHSTITIAPDVYNIPEELRTGQFQDEKFFYNINRVVALSQSNPDETALKVGIAVLRPKFAPYMDGLNDGVKKRIGRQLMMHHALRLKRAEKGISPTQFANQDRRMEEAERETICRRFMPKKPGSLPEDARQHIGKAFSTTEQYELQQRVQSGADDWQDISLRTFVTVMKRPLPH